jgi:cytosine/uracil/thiamine/allantoin permease
MGFILVLIALLLYPLIGVIDFFIVAYKKIKTQSFFKTLNNYWFQKAISIDVYGNENFNITFNALLRLKYGYSFGKKGETISSALGKNQRNRSLSFLGWLIVGILWVIDVKFWFKGGHCINSIM